MDEQVNRILELLPETMRAEFREVLAGMEPPSDGLNWGRTQGYEAVVSEWFWLAVTLRAAELERQARTKDCERRPLGAGNPQVVPLEAL